MTFTHDPRLARRSLIAGAGAGLAAAALPVVAAAQAPRKGGRFRLGSTGNTSDALDPATFGGSGIINLGLWGATYNNLTEIAADGRLAGELAESFEPSNDAASWTFKLRRGVTFHNGKTLDADDVVASINHHRGPDSKSTGKAVVDPIADIKADGKETVVITLASGNADFASLMTDYHLPIGPAREGRVDWEKAVGTGGYQFVSYDRGVRMVLKRNPNYWKAGHANFDEVELLAIADPTARINALVTGQVDAIGRVSVQAVALLKRNADIVVEETAGSQHYTIPAWTDAAPFNDRNVRLALKHAIDRRAMVDTILRGHGIVGNDQPLTPANRWYAKDIAPLAYDPEKAKALLRQAGHSSLKLDLSAADAAFVGAVDTAVLFKEHAAKAGIEINVVREPNDGYWSNVWLKKPFVMCFWAGRPTADQMFTQVYSKGSRWNDAHWENERFNQLLVAARTELDEAKRRDMYREMQLLVRDDGGTIVPMYANFLDGRSKRIARGQHYGSNFDLDGWKCIERWWSA